MTNFSVKSSLDSPLFGKTVVVEGWLKTRRDSKGGFSFLEINDGSCLRNLQIVADKSLENYDAEVVNLFPGASLKATGELLQSSGAGQNVELRATKIKVYGFCDPTSYPLQKQRVSFEKLREVSHLRARTNTFGAVTRVRSALSFATHQFFQNKGFCYLNTPIITTSDCEGAGDAFHLTTIDLKSLIDAPNVRIKAEDDFFDLNANLTVSGQLEAETYACAVGKVYTFGPTFRAENSNTSRHLAEFWMIEPEIAFADLNDDATLAEEFVKYLVSYVRENCSEDIAFFDNRIDNSLCQRLSDTTSTDFTRVTYTEAIEILLRSNTAFEFPVDWGTDLQSEHERFLTEQEFKSAVIVTDFPKEIKPFYMRVNDDNKTVASMDVLLPNIGEIIGGSQREERMDILKKRMAELKQKEDEYWWYMDLRRFGTVPHAGFGLGFERIVQFCTGMANIRDVIPYPRTPKNAKF